MKTRKQGLFALAVALSMGALLGGCSLNQTKSFVLKDTSIQMEQYQEYTLQADLQNLTLQDVSWSTSEYSVASVKDGVVTSLATGRATISASYGGKSYSCALLVTATKVGRALSVSSSSFSLKTGEEATLTAVLKENGAEKSASIVYESSKPEIASVDSSGKITALARGNAVISAFCVYEGQTFTKDVPVAVKEFKEKEIALSFMDASHPSSSLAPYEGDGTALGFDDGESVVTYTSAGDYASRIFASEAYTDGKATYDRLAFRIKFSEAPANGTAFYVNGTKKILTNAALVSQSTGFVFYDYRGRVADYLRLGKVYLAVVNLNKFSPTDATTMGFAFLQGTTAYLGKSYLASEDALVERFSLSEPEELPSLNFVYAETMTGLDAGVEKREDLDPYWVGHSSGTSASWDEAIWNERVTIGGIDYATYRNYAYYGMDLVFTNVDFREIIIWTGGYALRLKQGMVITSINGTYQEGDLFVYQNDVPLAFGTSFEVNKVYSFKIRIQKDNLENVSFGLSVNSASKDPIYFGNPLLSLI